MSPRAAAALGLLAVLTAASLPAAAVTRGVRVGSYYFEDSSAGDGQVVVSQGDGITFTFEGDTQHTATVDGMFDSAVKNPGQTYTTGALMRPGTFTLYCQFHGAARHSTILVIRQAASPSPSPTKARPSPSRTAAPAPARSATTKPSRTPSSSPRATAASPSPSRSPSPSASPSSTPSASASPVVTSPRASASVTTSPAVAVAEPPDVAPAVALDDGGGWLMPTGVVLLAILLGVGAIALGRRRRTG
jgi:plastocyanin